MQKFRNNVIWTTVLTALAGVCLGLLSLYFAAAGSGAMCRFYLKDPLLAALNVLPFALFALLFRKGRAEPTETFRPGPLPEAFAELLLHLLANLVDPPAEGQHQHDDQ